MKKRNNPQNIVFNFFLQLITGVFFVFIIHFCVLKMNNLPVFNDKIILAYSINLFLAIAIFLTLFFLRKKLRDQLGFLFMGGSFLKFALFFIFFYPPYTADGDITRLEFMAFFIPYVTCLFIETLSLIRLLNLPEQNH